MSVDRRYHDLVDNVIREVRRKIGADHVSLALLLHLDHGNWRTPFVTWTCPHEPALARLGHRHLDQQLFHAKIGGEILGDSHPL